MVISIFCVLFHQLTSNWLLFWLVYFCVAVVLSIGKCGSGLFPTREIVFTESFFFTTKILCFFFCWFLVVVFCCCHQINSKKWKIPHLCFNTTLSAFVRVLSVGWNSNFRISSNCSSIELRIYIYIFFCPTPIQEQHFVQSWL